MRSTSREICSTRSHDLIAVHRAAGRERPQDEQVERALKLVAFVISYRHLLETTVSPDVPGVKNAAAARPCENIDDWMTRSTMHNPASAVVCTLTPGEIVTRRATLLPGLAARAQTLTPTVDGYRLRFEPSDDLVLAIGQAIDAERQCCRFLRFDLTVPPDGGPIELTLSGPTGTRAFLAAILDA